MKILHLEDEPWDSGIAAYAVSLAAEQSRRGDLVAFWGREGSPVLAQAAAAGVAASGWPAGPRGWLKVPALRRAAAAFAPDVIDAHTGSAHSVALAIAPKGAAVVRTRGDARPAKRNPMTRLTASMTDAFIAANSALKSSLESSFPGAAVRLVPQGVEGPERPAPLPHAPVVGMLARFDPVKGHDVLFAAARTLAASHRGLSVVCAGEGRLLAGLRASLSAAGVAGVVSLPGRVEDKWSFLASCRVGVVASTGSEAVSRAALEWMAAGRPVVASRVGGLPDLVEDGVTGLLVPPGDAQALAAALSSLLSDPARAEAMGRAGRERWRKSFSPEPFYAATKAVYDEAIHSLSSRR